MSSQVRGDHGAHATSSNALCWPQPSSLRHSASADHTSIHATCRRVGICATYGTQPSWKGNNPVQKPATCQVYTTQCELQEIQIFLQLSAPADCTVQHGSHPRSHCITPITRISRNAMHTPHTSRPVDTNMHSCSQQLFLHPQAHTWFAQDMFQCIKFGLPIAPPLTVAMPCIFFGMPARSPAA